MTGNEKLHQARDEIEAVLKKYDIAGYAVLHMPGFLETFGHYTPSYSRVQPQYLPDGKTMTGMRIQSKLDDYNGDAAAQKRDLEATANMLSGMAISMAGDAISILDVSKQVDDLLGSQHTQPEFLPRVDEAVEAKAEEIYNAWKHLQGWKPWKAGGNSRKQNEARRLAREQLSKG